ncbi:recombinase family protein [Streptomyces sp. NPDC001262]|uniref:recombinase family protein n=1 Tax=Streptomyces sp. NPDC001262 TaxID=3364552 RepID=UPI0036BF544F
MTPGSLETRAPSPTSEAELVSTLRQIPGIQTPIPNELTPAIGYIRVSMAREEMISPELQRKAILEWAVRTKHIIVDWVEDPDKTGRNFKRRIMEAVARVEAGEVGVIAVWKYSRFGRSRYGQTVNLHRVEQAGGQLLSATEDIDARTATGRLQRGIIMEFNAYESDRAAEQWAETHEYRRSVGLPSGGRARFGYIWHPRKVPDGKGKWILQDERYEIGDTPEDKAEHEAIVEAYVGHAASRLPFGEIARRWKLAGWKTGLGTEWTPQAVAHYLDSGFAAGLLVVHRKDVHCPNRGQCNVSYNRAHREYIPGAHEAHITPEQWEDYEKTRERELANTAPKSVDSGYTFTGFTWCPHCRKREQVIHTGSKRKKDGTKSGTPKYWCTTRRADVNACVGGRIPLADLEQQGHEWIVKVADDIQRLALGMPVPELENDQDDTEEIRRRLEADVSRYTAAMERALVKQALDEDPAPADVHQAAMKKLKALRDQAQEELDKLPEPKITTDPVDFLPIILDLVDGWEEMTNQGRRGVLTALLRRVIIDVDSNVQWAPMWEPDPFPEEPEKGSRKGSRAQMRAATR